MRYFKICLIALLFATDQITKLLVHRFFELHEARQLLGTIVRLTYYRNMGGAFGIRFGGQTFLTITTTIIVILLFYLYFSKKFRPRKPWGEFSLLMVMGGALGNLFGRWFRGEVIDFIDIGIGDLRWPIFNVADIWITLGIIGLIIYYSFFNDEKKHQFV